MVNERRGVNEISVLNFLYPLITCLCLVFLYLKRISNRESTGELQTF